MLNRISRGRQAQTRESLDGCGNAPHLSCGNKEEQLSRIDAMVVVSSLYSDQKVHKPSCNDLRRTGR